MAPRESRDPPPSSAAAASRQGIYLHPQDPAVADRDPRFQGYGETTKGEGGSWSFHTIDPGYHEPRPRHIHVEVLGDGAVVLTSQIYFADDPEAGSIDPRLVASIGLDVDESGGQLLRAEHVIVLDH